ncbi:hypothetical protein ABBQ32_009914 [Trebouxia sp. C0010 RCD-2024]
MAAMTSVSLLSVQARPARQFGMSTTSRNARPRSSPVMASSKACGKVQLQTVTQQAVALLAATQLLAAPFAGPALAVDTSDAKGAVESIKNVFKGDKTGAAIGGAVSGQGAAKPGVSDATSQVVESIKTSQGGKASEADYLADKFSKDQPSSGAPSTAGVGKTLGTTDGGL